MSRTRITAQPPKTLARTSFGPGMWRDRNQAGIRHACRQQRHHGEPLDALHAMPARDLRQRASAAEAEIGSGVHHTYCDARRFFAHGSIVKGILAPAQAPLLQS